MWKITDQSTLNCPSTIFIQLYSMILHYILSFIIFTRAYKYYPSTILPYHTFVQFHILISLFLTVRYNIMAPGRNIHSANVARVSILRALRSNKSGRISATGFSHQVIGIQVELPKTVPKKTTYWVVTKIQAKTPATKEVKKYVDVAEDNFEIDFDYSPGQWVTELSDSDGENLFSTYRGRVSGLYTTIFCLKTGWMKG